MPELSGLEVAQQAAGKAQVAFITANDQHAIEAFDRGAIDYVQKPPREWYATLDAKY